MPKYNFLSGKMASNKNSSGRDADSVSSKAAKAAYRASETASDYAKNWENSSEEDLKDLFERAEDQQNKEKYGYAYLMKKYSKDGWEPFIDEVYTSTSSYGVESSSNPFVKVMENLKEYGKSMNETAQKTLANILYEDPDEALENSFYLYQASPKKVLDSMKNWTDVNNQAEALNILSFLHTPQKMKRWRKEELTDEQISEIEAKKDFNDFKTTFVNLQNTEPEERSLDKSDKDSTEDLLDLTKIDVDKIDWSKVPKASRSLLEPALRELVKNARPRYK